MENDLNQQIAWLQQEVTGAVRAAATRQDHVRLVQIQARLDYIAALAVESKHENITAGQAAR